MAKTVFIGHPIGGDVKNNTRKVLEICKAVHSKEIIPVAPYLVSLEYLNDLVVEDRALGMEANHECFKRGFVDELWLFGDRISEGMKGEIALARKHAILIVPKTDGTKQDLKKIIN